MPTSKYKTCPKCRAPMMIYVTKGGKVWTDAIHVSEWRCTRSSCAHEITATDVEKRKAVENFDDEMRGERSADKKRGDSWDRSEYTRRQMRSGKSRFGAWRP